ncbi:MAG: hypothetical protein ACTHLP_13455 [Rhizobiaceae bacterium]|jgi:hypothetical protein
MRSSRSLGLGLLLALTLLAAAPFISVALAATIANSLGCRLDEGSAHPCLFAGIDLGSMLYTMGVMGWLMLATGPFLLALMVVWLVVGAVGLFRRKPTG